MSPVGGIFKKKQKKTREAVDGVCLEGGNWQGLLNRNQPNRGHPRRQSINTGSA